MKPLYVDPGRGTGSQAERPASWHDRQFICFDGYQRFCLAPHKIKIRKHDHKKKYTIIRPHLVCEVQNAASIIDLGCSAGAMGFQAYLDGFRNITFIDHDPEYLQLVQAGLQHIGATTPTVHQSKAQEVASVADILFAFALVHWLYSCTEDFGSLERIVEKLSQLCQKAMFIEWIDPECRDIQTFGHLARNPEFHKETYNRDNFVRALQARFPHVKRIGKVRFGREIWLASHDQYRPQISDLVRQRIGFLTDAISTRILKINSGGMLQLTRTRFTDVSSLAWKTDRNVPS